VSVAVLKTYVIHCDFDGCTNRVQSTVDLDKAKSNALLRAWQVADDTRPEDLCSTHVLTRRWENKDGDVEQDSVRAAL
jgi:hypothetical protein